MLTPLLALLIVYAWWAPDSWLGAALTRHTARAVARLAAIRPLTLLCFAAVIAAFAGLIAYGQVEGLIMAALAAPETFAMFLAIDVGLALEVLALAWLAAGRGHLGAAVRQIRAACQGLRRPARLSPRARRPRRPRTPASPANGDEPGWAAFARAA